MITDEEMALLPADPELAFVAVEKILRQRIEERETMARNNDFSPDPDRMEYMTKVLAAAHVYEITPLVGLKITHVARNDIWDEYSQFKTDVDFVNIQIRLRAALIDREGSIGLDETAKRKIHHFIQQIKDEIEHIDLEADKKDSLLAALNSFAREVDRSRTRMQAGMALWMKFMTGMGEGFEKLKPVRELLDSIARVMGKVKDFEDHYSSRLPGPAERKRLEPPPSRPAQTTRSTQEVEDEIPF